MSVLDLDFYKLTMLQFIWKHYADIPVTFRLHSRKQNLSDIVNPNNLRQQIDDYRSEHLFLEEFEWLQKLGIFEEEFLRSLDNHLANIHGRNNMVVPEIEGSDVTVSGSWFHATLWETVILSAVSEHYSRDHVNRPDQIKRFADIYTIGQSGAKWADFGTRRRFSWYDHSILMQHLRDFGDDHGFIGTSNVNFAKLANVNPIGTYAHELEMVLRSYFRSEFNTTRDVLTKWQEMYPRELRIALTDTYTTPHFLENHGKFLLDNDWRGVRLDSGDPFIIGYMVQDWLSDYSPNSTWDSIFSNGLVAPEIVHLQKVFGSSSNPFLNPYYGWGTGLTNPNSDLSIVMKAVESNGKPTYKITDDAEKSIR